MRSRSDRQDQHVIGAGIDYRRYGHGKREGGDETARERDADTEMAGRLARSIERVGRPLNSAQHTALPMATRRFQGCGCSTHKQGTQETGKLS